MRRLWLGVLVLAGCGPWVLTGEDLDGDGYTLAEGDCWDQAEGPLDDGPAGADIHPGAMDAAYDGVDADCAGDDDFDLDEDGYATAEVPGRGGVVGDDCDDVDPAVNPGAAEVWYDGVDADCAGDDDFDQDGDGAPCAGAADASGACEGDCDDTDPARYPTDAIPEVWYNGFDEDCDGNDGDQDGDGFWVSDYEARAGAALPAGAVGGDCLDEGAAAALNGYPEVAAADIYPGAADAAYDGVDGDCAGGSDFDADGDGYDSASVPGAGGAIGEDCDDGDAAVSPAAAEIWYDGADQDCDGGSDYDQDGDGYDSDLFGGDDCDDANPVTHPQAMEDCGTAADDDCDGATSEPDAFGAELYWRDQDGDGYGAEDADPEYWCPGGDPGRGYTATAAGDCDDGDGAISPAAAEVCDGFDDDCDGLTDDADASVTGQPVWYEDLDGDGYGDGAGGVAACAAPTGRISDGSDCDDGDEAVSPAAVEVCDGADNDCDVATAEDGMVHLYQGAAVTDLSASWNLGGAAAVTYTLPDSGTILVCAGTYAVRLTTFGATASKTVEIVGVAGAAATVLDGLGSNGPVLTVSETTGYTHRITARGLTLTGGRGNGAGGIYYGGGAAAISQNSTDTTTDLRLESCVVTGNSADYGGGVAAGASGGAVYGRVELVDTEVYANAATASGGGVFVANGRVMCASSDGSHGIYANTSSGTGGGAHVAATTSSNGALLRSDACDWGTGVDDNSPADIYYPGNGGGTYDTTGGAGVTFECEKGGCSP